MAVVVPAIGQQQWGDPLNNALLGLDAAIQGKADLASLSAINTQIQSVQLAAAQANTTANSALTAAQNVPGTIKVSVSPPTSPAVGAYWDDGTGLKRWNGSSWQPPNYYRPVMSKQVTNLNPTTGAGTQNLFTSAQWPAVSFTVPPSGQAWISIGASIRNASVGNGFTMFCAWKASGGFTESYALEYKGISTEQLSRVYATRRILVTGMTPGAAVVITPLWFASSLPSSGTTAMVGNGQLTVEPVPY